MAWENGLLRAQADGGRQALANAVRAQHYQEIALALGAIIVFGALLAVRRQRVLLRRIERLADVDALTGVLNRRKLLETGQRTINRCLRDGRPCALVMVDIDRFKDINDRHGHAAGDEALRAVSGALRLALRPEDLIGRYGGEEFALILPGASSGEARLVGERLRIAVGAMRPEWAHGSRRVTISGGIAIAEAGDGTGAELRALLERADRALYRAKDAGRDRIEFAEAPVPAAA